MSTALAWTFNACSASFSEVMPIKRRVEEVRGVQIDASILFLGGDDDGGGAED